MYILLVLIQQNTPLLMQGVCKTLFTNYIVVQSLPRYSNNTLEGKSCFHDIHHITDMLLGPVRCRLHLIIILVKQYMYSSKHLQKELSLDELVKKLTTRWKLEKCIQMQYYLFKHNFIGILLNKEPLKKQKVLLQFKVDQYIGILLSI